MAGWNREETCRSAEDFAALATHAIRTVTNGGLPSYAFQTGVGTADGEAEPGVDA